MYDSYEPANVLTDEEMIQANHAEAVETSLEYKALGIKTVSWNDLKGLIYLALGIWLIFYLID
jgi:hypothetical protein